MKKLLGTALLLGALTLFPGCERKERGPAYGRQQEFRRQLADCIPVKEWRYAIADVRVSDDAKKVLVVFTLPGGTNGVSEMVLEHDGFRRYRGSITDAERRSVAERGYYGQREVEQSNVMARIRAGLPYIPPRPAPVSDSAPSLQSVFEAGKVSVLVTLPDR